MGSSLVLKLWKLAVLISLPLRISSSVSMSSIQPSPAVSGCYSYRTLNENDRNDNYVSSYTGYCDSGLQGWYRFNGNAGDRISQICQTGYYGCGSYYRGWMSGSLPSYYDGTVQRTVYFAKRGGGCYSQSTTVWVQNCWGSFYVYYFQSYAISCNYRYCGSHSQSSTLPSPSTASISASSSSAISASPQGDPCTSYQHLSDKSRNVLSFSYGKMCDASLSGWYRFSGEAGTKLLDRCLSYPYTTPGSCGTDYQGWIQGSLPDWYEGIVKRTMYFAYYRNCYSFQSTVWIRNCHGFYVYYLHYNNNNNVPCNYRYCGMADIWYMTPSAQSQSVYSTQYTLSSISLQPTPAISSSDGCKYYQILSDPTRAHSYRDWYTNRCDSHLNGWYRFMGRAGNKMQNSCSYGRSGHNKCGSRFQGWLLNSHPSYHEGEVYRTVCFSRDNSCYCNYKKAIKVKNCGNFYVYWLDGTPTCNLRYCGAKDSMTKVSCSSNYMRIDLDRKFYDASLYQLITLRDPSCWASYGQRFISLGSVPNYCGSTRQEVGNHIIYTNEVILTAKQNSDMITRDHDEVIQFSCKYEKKGYVSGASYLPVSRITGNESSIGSFTFYFEMFKNKQYTTRYYSYPVKVQLRDSLYFQAFANTQDSGLVLLVDQCYSTPTLNRQEPSKYLIINNGCPLDKTVQFHSATVQKQRFSIQAFRYLNNQSTVFIHCLLMLCQNTSRDFRCTSGCTGNNINRARFRRDLSDDYGDYEKSYSQYYLLEAGPVVLDEGTASTDKQGDDKSNKTLIVTVIALVGGMVGMAVIVAVLLKKMRKANTEAKREVKELGIDNATDGNEYVVNGEEDETKGETAM